MPDFTSYQPGTPCWIDLMAPDQQAALDFYRDLFGWQGEVGPAEFGGYAMCMLNGKPVAGIMGAQPDTPAVTAWTTYFASSDADATQKAIAEHGGVVLYPVMDVGTLGRMLVASDPTGAVFGVWEPKDFAGAGVANEPGSLIWSELNTSDTDAAAAFYRAVLGLETAPMEGAEGYLGMNVNGRPIGGMRSLDELPPGTPSHWLVYFAVDDVDSTVDALVRADGDVLMPPFDMMAGRMAAARDPQGGVFAMIAPTPMQTA